MSVFIGDKTNRVELAERKDAINPNLFSNTDEMSNFWQPYTAGYGYVEPSASYTSDTNHELIATKSVFHVWGPTSDISAPVTTQQIYFKPGTYTISFLARNNGTDHPSFTIGLYSDYTDPRGDTPLGATSTNLTNVWQQYSITFEITEAGTYSNWRLLNSSKLTLPGGSLYFANLKLEHGSVATPWCPALEDYAWKSDITNLMGMQQTLQTTVSSNQTDIATLQGKETNLEATVSKLSQEADDLKGRPQVKQYTAAQESQAISDSASGNILGVISDS